VERTTEGHVVEVRLPEEIRLPRPDTIQGGKERSENGSQPVNWEEANFLQDKALRQAIHARERGHCFYCLRRTNARTQCLDHVVPRALFGRNSYRNLVSCCQECNARKGARQAGDFLCGLFREARLTSAQLTGRLRALEKLAKGGMRPEVRK
jgi:5-methylcytosine-specific restriction endonuclease McrA